MLTKLSINNYILIDKAILNLKKGFTTLTGETGSGKSILLGALNILLGGRVDYSVIDNEEKKCVLEANFNISKLNLKHFFNTNELDYDNDCIIRKEISKTGKTRSFINDTPVNISILKELKDYLIDIHSQHQTIDIKKNNYAVNLIDEILKENTSLVEYQKNFTNWNNEKKKLEDLINQSNQNFDLDYNLFLLSELQQITITQDEFNGLEERYNVLENAESIKSTLGGVYNQLSYNEVNIIDLLNNQSKELDNLSNLSKDVEQINDRLKSVFWELKDISTELESFNENIEHNPEELVKIHDTIDLINKLFLKHQCQSIDELIEKRDHLEKKIKAVTEFDQLKKKKEETIQKLVLKLNLIGEKQHKERKKVSVKIEEEMKVLLNQLSMPNAEIKIAFNKLDFPSKKGIYQIDMLFSANKGSSFTEISKSASGGELSRVMLSVKYLLCKHKTLPTIIFDEIDSGVSGNVANKMGLFMTDMSNETQIISITHSAQIAAAGNSQWKVYKDNNTTKTRTYLKELSTEERTIEIATMLSADKITDAAIQQAELLLN